MTSQFKTSWKHIHDRINWETLKGPLSVFLWFFSNNNGMFCVQRKPLSNFSIPMIPPFLNKFNSLCDFWIPRGRQFLVRTRKTNWWKKTFSFYPFQQFIIWTLRLLKFFVFYTRALKLATNLTMIFYNSYANFQTKLFPCCNRLFKKAA